MRITSLRPGGRVRFGSRRFTSAVALDIGADAVVALQPAGDGGRMRKAIVHPIPVGLVVDGEVVDPAGLVTELQALFSEHRLPRDVRVGLAHPRLMVRLVELPGSIDGSELDNAVRHLATDLLPVGLDQLVVDYRRIGRVPGTDRGGLQRILMAAARVDGIDRLTTALTAAGLRLQGISLSGLAMVSALEQRTLPGEAILYVQAGALTNVVITEDGQPLLVRAASAGSESIAAGLAERARISHEEARATISSLGLGPAPHHGSPAPIPDELQAIVAQQVREGLRRVVAEVQSSRGVYAARPDACPIGAVVLTGAMTTWPGVVQALEDDLHLPVLVAGRESWPQLDDLGVAAERLDVVVGLVGPTAGQRPDLRPAATARATESSPLSSVVHVGSAMLAVLALAVVYLVVISNQVSSGRERLVTIGNQLAAAESQAAALKPYDDFARATLARREAVSSVASTRFNWDRALTELAEIAPGGVWLTSLKGTLTPTTSVEGGGGGGAGTLRAALPGPALELEGCALREGKVPAYIDRLQGITGVTQVGFSRSERLEKAAGEKSASGPARPNSGASASSGDCRNGDEKTAQFSLVTYFKADAAQQAATAAAAGAGTPAAAQPAAPNTGPAAPSPAAGVTTKQTASAATGGSK